MKKFFSLVLALAMTLSLTTMAWGAPVEVATEGDLIAALGNSAAVEIKLTADITATGAAAAYGVQTGRYDISGKTIDLNGNTLTVVNESGKGNNMQFYGNNFTIKNGEINVTGDGRYWIIGDYYQYTVSDNVVLDSLVVNTGINIYSSTNVVLKNNTVVSPIDNTYPVFLDEMSSVTIESGSYTDNGDDPVLYAGVSGSTITVTGGTFTGTNAVAEVTGATVTINGGTFTDDVSDYLADGVVTDGNGNYTTVPASYARYTFWASDVAATATGTNYIATDMQLPEVIKAVAPVAPALNGSVAYYELLGAKCVQGTAADCDAYFTLKGKTTPVMYLKVIGSEDYIATATTFTNFGKACGQVNATPAADTKYYTYTDANDNVYVYAEDTSTYAFANATDFLLVGGKMIPVVTTNLYTNLVPHSWLFAKNAAGVVDSAKCVDCGATAKVYSTYTAVPTGADYIREGAYFLVINAPAATGTKPVQSAQTFDAGIAMYVGMSVMAAAGSVVVFKKRED